MDIIIVFICFLFSAIIPQALYFIFPILFLYSLWLNESLSINRITKLYLGIFLVVFIFLIIHIVVYQSIEFIFLKGLLRYASYASFALYLATLSRYSIRTLFKIILVFFVISFPLLFFQMLVYERYYHIFLHPNYFAYVLVICLMLFIKEKLFLNIRPIICLILIASLIMTKASGAILTLLVFLLFHYRAKLKSFYIRIPIIAISLLFVIIGFSFSPKIIEQINSLQYLDWTFIKDKALSAQPGGYGSFIWRVIYWTQILFAFFDNSTITILFGEGIDSLTKANRGMYSFLYTDPHNDFLKILVEYGILGFSLFILLLYRFYSFLGKRVDILLIIVIPFFFDNMLVNWSYNVVFLLYITYIYKTAIMKR